MIEELKLGTMYVVPARTVLAVIGQAIEPVPGSSVGCGCSVGTDPTAVDVGVQCVQALNSVLRDIEEIPSCLYELNGFTQGFVTKSSVRERFRKAIEKASSASSHGGEDSAAST